MHSVKANGVGGGVAPLILQIDSGFYVHGSVYHRSILINVQWDATICSLYFILLQNHSTCFGCRPHPSSGVPKTVVTATGTSHMTVQLPQSNVAKWPCWSKVVTQIIWLVPVAVVTVLCTPDDGCGRHSKHVEWFCSKIKYRLHIVASHWTFINIDSGCRWVNSFKTRSLYPRLKSSSYPQYRKLGMSPRLYWSSAEDKNRPLLLEMETRLVIQSTEWSLYRLR